MRTLGVRILKTKLQIRGVSTYIFFFLFHHQNICSEFSLEAPHRGASNAYPQHMFVRIFMGIQQKRQPLMSTNNKCFVEKLNIEKVHLISNYDLHINCMLISKSLSAPTTIAVLS